MAEDNARPVEESGVLEVERKPDRPSGHSGRPRDPRAVPRVKDRSEESRLPTPPPDPQGPPIMREGGDTSTGVTSGPRGPDDEEEDLAVYLGELAASPFDGHSFDYDTNTPNSVMGGDGGMPFAEEAFEHLDRMCALTEQILELRDRSCKLFRRVRGLERAKAQRSADRRLEIAMASDEELLSSYADEDTGFAESLLDAMLSNCRDAASTPRRGERSSSSRQRSRSLALAEQQAPASMVPLSVVERDEATKPWIVGGPKVSKWTRVKAAFKWERACTNDLPDIAETSIPLAATSSPTTRYLRLPDATSGSWSGGSALSPCTSEISSPSTPIGRVSSASSSNEEVFDEVRKSINYPDRPTKDDKKKDDSDLYGRSCDTPIMDSIDSIESASETNRGKPLIRIISDHTDVTMNNIASGSSGRDSELTPKKSTPTLMITIPSNEEEIRSLSSPDSMSPLLSSAQDSGGSSPQRPKARDTSSPREFKRQYSTIEETPAPKIQRQDSKWNKVRRAFLTNATFSVPPSPVKVVTAQSFANDDTRRARSCSESVEDLSKTVAGTNNGNCCNRAEVRRDYQALREKFGAEFHRKLIEWERLKSARNARDGLPLNEERLAPEFRKKLQDWKRAKKGRRSSAAIEQQRVSRRRLTDWQLWRSSSSKPDPRCYGKNQNSIGSRGSCASIGSAGSFGSDARQHLCEDFVKRMETWRRMSEVSCRGSEGPRSPINRVTSDIIDETEFLALEKLLLLFGQKTRKERRESDAKQLDDCFDGDSRFSAASRGANCGNEVLIRTSVGSYRFEGISREFTRKLYDWEKYRGISPRSSTFRLLGPGYTPGFAQDSIEAAEPSSSTTGKNRAFHWTLKRSKSDGSIFEGGIRDESFTLRRSASLQSLSSTDKLEDDARMDTLPASNNSQVIKDPSEDMVVEDSEPEAMIVDIEDVIEETASPLAGVQPHQTPVYSVAASETTSIAVPLGTVTSSHEPSPVFLVDAEEEDNDCERWNRKKWIGPEAHSSENSPSPKHFHLCWHDAGTTSLNTAGEPNWNHSWCKEDSKEDENCTGWTVKMRRSILDDDFVKSERSLGWNRDTWDESSDEANKDSMGLELPLTPIYEGNNERVTTRSNFFGSDKDGSTHFAETLESSSAIWNEKELTDSSHVCKEMNETEKDPAETNNERTSEDLPRGESREKTERKKIILSTDHCTYQLARTLSSTDCSDFKEVSSKLSNLNLDDNKNAPKCGGDVNNENEASAHYESCSSPESQMDADRHYEILAFKTDARDDIDIDNRLYEPINCYENHIFSHDNTRNNSAKEHFSSSKLPGAQEKNLLIDSTIRTIPLTVSRNNDARCLERILINEKTLNKIIVPTASAESEKTVERRRDDIIMNNELRTDEVAAIDDRSARTTRDQAECARKDSSTSRNVFVKTKRMIFGPFRRSEDRSAPRKESDGSVDGRLSRSSKSKSKSRSASPKLCRQDALLRMSLSLPWPLRSTSKESEVSSGGESRRSSGSKMEDAISMTQEKNRLYTGSNMNNRKPNRLINPELSLVDLNRTKIRQDSRFNSPRNARSIGISFADVPEQVDQSAAMSIEQDQNARRIRDETQDDAEHAKYIQRDDGQHEGKQAATNSQKQAEGKREQDESTKQQKQNSAGCDVVPSDLMHKLRILSDAAAKREGRVTSAEACVNTSLESRSSRIRRAKESFLSRRGGPFCRSTMEPEAVNYKDAWRRRSTSQALMGEAPQLHEATMITSNCEEEQASTAGTSAQIVQDEAASSSEDKVNAYEEKDLETLNADIRSESLVKSASAGMINVDADTFGRLAARQLVDRGCESLPRTIAKRRDSANPLAKIVNKLKFSRLIRARNADNGGNMSTISTLCRQSLLIDMRYNIENRPDDEQENHSVEAARDKNEDHPDGNAKIMRE